MKIVTHSGMFHIDDVFAVAAALLMYPGAEVVRSRDPEVIRTADLAIDVGMEYDPEKNRFDHHMPGGSGIRPNGIPYASFGLVWKKFGLELAGEASQAIEEKLVMPIDAPDNGVSTWQPVFEGVAPYTIFDVIYSYMDHSREDSPEYLYQVFMQSVDLAKGIIEREIAKAKERLAGMERVREILEAASDKRVIVIEERLPWEAVLVPAVGPIFVVYPRREGNWGVKGVPAKIGSFERKKLFPESWAGAEGEDFKKLTGVADAVFCHRGRWLCAADSKEGALKLAEIALNS